MMAWKTGSLTITRSWHLAERGISNEPRHTGASGCLLARDSSRHKQLGFGIRLADPAPCKQDAAVFQ
jgi:hypothetical protein